MPQKSNNMTIRSHTKKGFGVARHMPAGNGTHFRIHGSKSEHWLSRSWSLVRRNTTGYRTRHTTRQMVVQRMRWLYLSQATRWHDAMILAHSKDCCWQANHVPFAVAYCKFTKLSADNPFGFTCTVSPFPNISVNGRFKQDSSACNAVQCLQKNENCLAMFACVPIVEDPCAVSRCCLWLYLQWIHMSILPKPFPTSRFARFTLMHSTALWRHVSLSCYTGSYERERWTIFFFLFCNHMLNIMRKI